MSNYTVSNIGQNAGSGSTTASFLKVFSGEVITAFETANSTLDKHLVRTISSGKSAQFPIVGKATASYHTAGNEITGGSITHNERTISIENLLIAPVFIAKIDEAMSHYDVRSIYSKELGRALANQMDKHVYQNLILNSRASALSPQAAGTALTDADFETNAASAAATIFSAAKTMDEADVPADDRYVAVSPAAYYNLIQGTTVINRDWGGSGSYSDGKVLKVAGMNIIPTNNIPTTNITSGVAQGSSTNFAGNFSTTVACAWQKNAVGTVKLMDLSTEMDYQIQRQGTLVVAKYAMGHAPLNPICSIEIKTS
jgi:hypothetical protein